ncbi:MAG TPA: imidazolonepropionase [Gemmata sp.]|jgi:imidazolonepropionase|nr:imidazolonepropionase [Gemmata sp.]
MEPADRQITPQRTDTQHLWVNAKLATFDSSIHQPYGLLDGWAIATRGDRIAAILPPDSPGICSFSGIITDIGGRWITPGLIDCHTHLVYGGTRAQEWEKRLSGVPYAEIARQGGGILSTVRATRALTEDELVSAAVPRLHALIAEGVTCVEIKSGYGLTTLDEIKMLLVARRLAELYPVEVSLTLLAAHAVPPEFVGRSDEYVDVIIEQMIPTVSREGLAEAVDVFCETIAFSREQCDRIFTAARLHGLAVKGHVEQLSNQRGAELIAQHRGWSCDHIEYLDDTGVGAMASAGTIAVLLPGAFYFLREKQKPPVEQLRAAGVPMAVASDFNPGTSPLASLRLAMNMACVLFGLTPEESLAGATREAARALGRGDRLGTLEVGKQADFLVWDVQHPAEIVCQLGVNPLFERIFRGRRERVNS